jgi:hypothetical protein
MSTYAEESLNEKARTAGDNRMVRKVQMVRKVRMAQEFRTV